MKRKALFFLAPMLVFACLSKLSYGQESFYKVYQFETPLQGRAELNLYTTYIPNSHLDYGHFNQGLSRKGLFAHSLEAEYAITDHLSFGAYADFEDPKNGDLKFIQSKFEALYRFGERFDHFINVAAYAEYYLPTKAYSTSQEAEFRLILDKDIEDFRIVANPIVSRNIGGTESKDLQYSLSAGLYYRRAYVVQPGVEFFSNYFEHSAAIFPTVDIRIGPHIDWNLGAGFGLNNNSDDFIVKSILLIDFQLFRPSDILRKPLR